MTEPTDSLVEIVARAMLDGLDKPQRREWMDDEDFAEAHAPLVSGEVADVLLDGHFNLKQVAQVVLTALSEAGPTEAMMQAVDAHCSGPIAQWAWRAMLAAAGEHSHAE